jgi:hypothetical protein
VVYFANWIVKVTARLEADEKSFFARATQKSGITEVSIAPGPEDLMRIQFVVRRQADSVVK